MDDLPRILLTPMLAEATAADGDAGRTHAHGTGNGRSGDDVAFVSTRLTVGLFSTTGFTDDLAAKAAASRGKIRLLTLDERHGQSS